MRGRSIREYDLAKAGRELQPAPNDYRTPEMVALVTASIAARKNLAATVPTTVEGIAAALDYATAYHDEIRIPLFDSAKETQIFMQSLASVRAISRGRTITVPVVNSRHVAHVFGKRHADVLRDIDAVLVANADLRSRGWLLGVA
jgi:hypothetical protein